MAINELSSKGVVKGYPTGEFHPEGLINRAEAVKILIESRFPDFMINSALEWHTKAGHSYVMFPDVPIDQWYGKYVEISYQNKVVKGYPTGEFKPANNINFAEALKVILESYKVNVNASKKHNSKFILTQDGEWYERYFNYAYQANLINREKVYHPGQLITRGEFVEVIYRLESILKTRQNEYTELKKAHSNEYSITIPKLNVIDVNVNFANVYDSNQALDILKDGLGHYLKPPSAEEKMVLFGHSSGFSWDDSNYKTILREINKLKAGDRIYLNYQEKGYVYEIYHDNIIPASLDYTLIENPTQNELALYTCWPPNSIAQRYVVYGKPV